MTFSLQTLSANVFNVPVVFPPKEDCTTCIRVKGNYQVDRNTGVGPLPRDIAKKWLKLTEDYQLWPPAGRIYRHSFNVQDIPVSLIFKDIKMVEPGSYQLILYGMVVQPNEVAKDDTGKRLLISYLARTSKKTNKRGYNPQDYFRYFNHGKVKLVGTGPFSIERAQSFSLELGVIRALEEEEDAYREALQARNEAIRLWYERARLHRQLKSPYCHDGGSIDHQKNSCFERIDAIFDESILPLAQSVLQPQINEQIKASLYTLWGYC